MPRKKSPKAEQLMRDFVTIRQKNPEKSIAEIAKEYGISNKYLYGLIPEISEMTGIPKEALLPQPHRKTCMPKNVRDEELIETTVTLLEEAKQILKEIEIGINHLKKGEG